MEGPRPFREKWQRIAQSLNIGENVFTVNDDSVYCRCCNRQLRGVTESKIALHLNRPKHLAARAAVNDPEAPRREAYRRILDELQLSNQVYVFTPQGVMCHYCDTVLQTITTQVIRGHDESQKHQEAAALNATPPHPTRGACAISSPRQSAFWTELCDSLLLADIPLDKLRNPFFRRFLEKWTRHTIPDPTTLRNGYVDLIYEAKVQKMREEIGDNPIALSVDETTDKTGRCVVNAVVTPLLPDRAGTPRLVHCGEVEKADGESIVAFVNDALAIIWPNGIHHERFLVYNTDSARYMKRSARLLREEFPKMVNCTCVAHAWNLVLAEVRNTYPEANGIISETKKVFRKAPNRVRQFHEQAPGIPLPPEPVLTRWCTWLEAAIYYAANFHVVARVIADLEPDAECVEEAQELFEEPGIDEIFETICNDYSSIVTTIKKLETRELLLRDSIQMVENMRREIMESLGVPRPVTKKMFNVFEDNEGYTTMKAVSRYLETGLHSRDLPDWSEADFLAARYAPITSVEIERTFSRYKKILASDRQSFTQEHVAMHVVVNCFPQAL